MIETQYLIDKIFHQHSDKPDLLISDRTTWPLIHSVLGKGRHKVLLDFANKSIVKIYDFCLVSHCKITSRLSCLQVIRSEDIIVVFEKFIQLIEVSHPPGHCFCQTFVSLNNILFLLHFAVDRKQLEAGLAIASFSGLSEKLDSSVNIFSHPKCFLAKHA